jgi:hypothetical protein
MVDRNGSSVPSIEYREGTRVYRVVAHSNSEHTQTLEREILKDEKGHPMTLNNIDLFCYSTGSVGFENVDVKVQIDGQLVVAGTLLGTPLTVVMNMSRELKEKRAFIKKLKADYKRFI